MNDKQRSIAFKLSVLLIALVYVLVTWQLRELERERQRQSQLVDPVTYRPVPRDQTETKLEKISNIVGKTYLGDRYEPTNCPGLNH